MKKLRAFLSHRITSTVIMVLSVAIFIYASYGITNTIYQYKKSEKEYNEVQEMFQSQKHFVSASTKQLKSTESIEEKKYEVRDEFKELIKQNDETVGWISIDDTNVDYPIMQSDNNVDYLTKTFSGEEALTGSIFLDYRNDLKNSDEKNFIVYGHRVSDGSMFEHLTKYLDEDFFESHRTFTFDTLYDEYEAEVFAVYNTMIDFNYIETDFETDNEFELMLNEFKDRSIYDVDVDVSKDDQILTLSTCEYTLHPDDSRLVVQAKLTKK